MAAITADLCDVLVVGVSAVIAAIFLIAAYRAGATVVAAFVVVVIRHNRIPQVRFKFY
jgi:hypothetical protein